MRKIVVSEYMSLDGVIEEPRWTQPYWGDDIAKFKFDELFASDSLLLGRKTYEGFAQAWPTMTDEAGFADRMNSMPKAVATRTLQTLAWNASALQGDIAEEVAKLKQQDGQNILLYGSGDFVQTLIKHGLIDQYNLLVYPVVLGHGQRLFEDGTTTTLKLVSAQSFNSGVVAMIYEPDRK